MHITRRADPNHNPGGGEGVMLFVLLFSCSIAGLIASDVMALLVRLLPFL